jgi:flagellar biosynthesis protein FlhG
LPGPAGLFVAAGAWGLDLQAESAPGVGYQWIKQLRALGDRADFVLLDGGTGVSRTTQRLLQAVDLALLVTTPDAAALANTAALLKIVAEGNPRLRVQCLVNRATEAETARQTLERIVRANFRSLGVRPQLAGHIPNEPFLQATHYGELPLLLAHPECDAAKQLRHLAAQISVELLERRPPQVFHTRLSGSGADTSRTDLLYRTTLTQET